MTDRVAQQIRFILELDQLKAVLRRSYLLSPNANGRTWKENGIRKDQVLEVNAHIEKGSSRLWQYIRGQVERAAERGYLAT